MSFDQVADCLAKAAYTPEAHGKVIDIASEPPLSEKEFAAAIETALGRKLKVQKMPLGMLKGVLGIGSNLSLSMKYLNPLLEFLQSGNYIADTTQQKEIFGPPVEVQGSLVKLFKANGI